MKKIKLLVSVLVLSSFLAACANADVAPPVKQQRKGVYAENYVIVIASDATDLETYAANELKKYFALNGVDLDIAYDSSQAETYEICIGSVQRDNNPKALDDLGEEGFIIKNEHGRVFIAGNTDRAILYGTYTFLEDLGFRFYAKDVEKIPDDQVKIWSDLDVKQVPQFSYRDVMYSVAWDTDWSVKQKVNGYFLRDLDDFGGSVAFAGGPQGLVHTFNRLVPEHYFAAHPEYFSLINGQRVSNGQLCLTNTEVKQLVTEAALSWIAEDADIKYISISQNDNDKFCECPTCTASNAEFGLSGTLLNFVNDVAREIKNVYPHITVITLAYGPTIDVPVGVKPDDNVLIELCTQGERSSPLEENSSKLVYSWDGSTSSTKGFIEKMDAWKQITDRFFIWDYVANYYRINAPWPNFHIFRQNMNLFAQYGAMGIYSEGTGMTTGEFAELKSYLLAKLSWNPLMSEEEYQYHFNDFLSGYYGEGWQNIRSYIDALTQVVRQNEIGMGESSEMHSYLPYRFDNRTLSYDMTFINQLNDYWDAAESMADDEQLQRIKISRLQWTYYELHVTMDNRYAFGSKQEQYSLVQRCQQLYHDFSRAGIVYGVGNEMFKKNITDFSKSPRYWLGGNRTWPFD